MGIHDFQIKPGFEVLGPEKNLGFDNIKDKPLCFLNKNNESIQHLTCPVHVGPTTGSPVLPYAMRKSLIEMLKA